MSENLNNVLENYKHFVTKNPLLANEIEVGLKWASYIIAGRFSKSPVVTEFIHSASKLLNLVNDNILKKAAGIPISENIVVEKLQVFLTVIEHAEIFAEVAARRVGGRRGRWLIVIFLELTKFAIRLILLLKHEQGLQISPPISPINRQKDIPQLCGENSTPSHHSHPSISNVELTFSLQSSNRVIRTLDSAPHDLVSRTWELPKITLGSNSKIPSKLEGSYFAGEILHICRPLAHLGAMGVFGKYSWKPFFLALGLDLTSLHLLRQKQDFNKTEKLEMNRRLFSLLIYLLRSPLYDQYTRVRIISMLRNIADNFIGSGLILRPLIEYLPEWQKIYFYVWSG